MRALIRPLVVLGAVAFVVGASTAAGTLAAQGTAAGASAIERGRYLVTITGCHDCHSPKKAGMTPDLERGLSGRPSTTALPSKGDGEVHASLDLTAWTGPWGQSVASNLTPDPATGLGSRYIEATFITTMRTGKKPNGLALLPPMPSDVYQNMTDSDLKAIFAYLRSIKPVRNAVMAGIAPPPPPPAPAAGAKK